MTRPHVTHNSGKHEWYTPPRIIKAARELMGEIDLDPASTEIANTIVQADRFITKEEDALSIDVMWGTESLPVRVWLNPPYDRKLIDQFANRVLSEISIGRVSQALWLSNNATETVWGQKLLRHSEGVCFPYKRVKFLDMNLEAVGAPLQGQMIIALGNITSRRFRTAFDHIGMVAGHSTRMYRRATEWNRLE